MTKQELEQLWDLHKEIKRLELDITKLCIDKPSIGVIDSVRGGEAVNAGRGHVITIKGIISNPTIERLERILKKRKAACEDEKAKLEEWISTLSDSEIRQIMHERYFNKKPWKEIAVIVWPDEYHDESYVRKKHNRFLAKM